MKILIVEDNKTIQKDIEKELSKHFDTETCGDGEEGLYLISQGIYDLVILDLMLPNMGGIEILNQARKDGIDTPILILTAKEALDDKVEAFTLGANDYLTKPFYMDELVARVYAILRTNGKIKDKKYLEFKDLRIDSEKNSVYINDEEIELQNKQFKLLEYFVLNKGSILLKEQIYDRIWGIDSDATIEIVEVYVSNLRKKLSKYDYDKYIKTKRKVGYILDDKQ
ncbi:MULTISPECIES: response regulator transcription factor [Peptostreptococcus]|jgi:response regulator receiver domain protein|uniref:Stage 0 sporulation protein A homolog n=1 Tax=Peptostreptococcus stomatis DSM 17678 TaxID=596315 RepID=E0E468_9FIRM|nr:MULTISPECIES: response regulator transcription factor [Peptostreptococcus]EFM64317.1 response regulator receiver domain protein [Peptostreptococcus stomatis DSM 17678]MBF1044492.1 response regulator transcription factor [Peptostreptococcus sp.]MBF1048786.1 response regulator transcription factor [Peptostreptococcus sp.]MBF1049870.1 response regulator transcription factor [Peptostreptococcus sp.]MBF1057557.1 response regulator transcription factor [Peptostreptococcus sp.]